MINKRNTIKILQITKSKFPPEIRVLKEGLSFHKAGYKSAVLCPPYGNQLDYEIWNGIEIYRPKILGTCFLAYKILGEVAFFNPCWYRALRQTICRYDPDVLHVHDIWLAKAAICAKKKQKIVIDLHENMPAAVIEYIKEYNGLQYLFRYLFHSYNRIYTYENKILQKSDLVLTVVKEARDRILKNYSEIKKDIVVNIENYESKRFITNVISGSPSFIRDHFSVLYIGGFGPHRGVDTLIRSMEYIKEDGRNIKIQLIGANESPYLLMLKKMIKELGVSNQVQITGWVNSDEVLDNIKQADVCCVPHHSNPHTDTTIPHKLYQYMIAKRPVLVSSSIPLARTVKQAQAGLIFNAGDPIDCANKILAMANDKEACLRYAENGYKYVMNKGHNWEEESEPSLIDAYDRLCTNITKNK